MIGAKERLILGAVLVGAEKCKEKIGAHEGQIIQLTGEPKLKTRHYLETLTAQGYLDKIINRDPVLWSLTETGLLKATKYRANRRIPDSVRKVVLERDGTLCANTYCKDRNGLALSMLATEYDHKHPWSAGGDNHEDNVQIMCVICNRRKGAMRMENFLRLENLKVQQGDSFDPLERVPVAQLTSLQAQITHLLKAAQAS